MTTLAEKLNNRGVQADVEKGVVDLQAYPSNMDDLCNADGEVTDEKFSSYLDWLCKLKAYLDTHPYGREGGYVPFAEKSNGVRAWYNESEGRWQD
tara:strand:+ start:1793 stop:2077 length:285 start_codon:yes stop_codon:yes gene_type:complete